MSSLATQPKLIISSTQLREYESGNIDRALRSIYSGIPIPLTKAMKYGIKFHEDASLYANLHGRLPRVLGSHKIRTFQSEQRYRVHLTDQIIYDGTPDLTGLMKFAGRGWDTIIEFKTGVGSSASYSNEDQIYDYQIFRPHAEMARVYTYNQYFDITSLDLVYLDDRTLDRGVKHVINIGDTIMADQVSLGRKWWNCQWPVAGLSTA